MEPARRANENGDSLWRTYITRSPEDRVAVRATSSLDGLRVADVTESDRSQSKATSRRASYPGITPTSKTYIFANLGDGFVADDSQAHVFLQS